MLVEIRRDGGRNEGAKKVFRLDFDFVVGGRLRMLRRFFSKSVQTTTRMIATTVPPRIWNPIGPPVHRGLEKLDKSLFSLEIPLLAARVPTGAVTTFAKVTAKA